MRTHLVPSLLIALAGCSASVADLNDYTEDPAACVMDGDRNSVRDFEFRLVEMAPHSSHYFDILVTDQASDQLRSRFILEPLGVGTQDVVFEDALPPGDLNIQFYADTNGNRMIDNPAAPDDISNDHTWIRPVCSDGVEYFEHIFAFEPIVRFRPIGAGYELHLTNIPAELGSEIAETRLVFAGGGSEDGRTIAVHRRLAPPATDPPRDLVDFSVPGVIDLGNTYVLLWYFDADGDLQPSEGDVFCGVRDVAPADGADPQPLSRTIDMAVALTDGTCDLTALDAVQVPTL